MMKTHCCNLSSAEATKSSARIYSLQATESIVNQNNCAMSLKACSANYANQANPKNSSKIQNPF